VLTDKAISVVVTCYRDEGSILELLRRLSHTMDRITPNWEVIYVNDDSPDNAESVLLEQARQNDKLTVISHSRNFGAQVAFRTGIMQAVGDAVIIMDGDLQDPPELIEEFVRRWLEGYAVVYGIRAKRHETLIRNIGYMVFYRILARIAYIPIPLDAGEFSLMDRAVVDVILECGERDLLIRGLRAHAGFSQTGIPFERPRRYAGDSTQGLLAYMMWVIKSFTSYSLAPLRVIVWAAILMALLLGGLMLTYGAAYFGGGESPKGFPTLLFLTLGIGTVIMISLGVIAEYLGRLFVEVKRRPQPVIRTLVNDHRRNSRRWLGLPRPMAERTEGTDLQDMTGRHDQ
jgi:dolichol-phosphate mannosyltransferase